MPICWVFRRKARCSRSCVISESPRVETEYKNLRWNVFHNFEPGQMLTNIQTYVFLIRTIGEGKDTAFSRYMKDTVFLIPTAKVLAKVVDGIDAMDMNNKDIMGDVYEYLLGKIAAAGENGQFRTHRHIINMMVALMKPALKDSIQRSLYQRESEKGTDEDRQYALLQVRSALRL